MPDHPQLSIVRQCQLLNIARSSLYYQVKEPSDEELDLLRLIDQQYLETPFYGSRKITIFLQQVWLSHQSQTHAAINATAWD